MTPPSMEQLKQLYSDPRHAFLSEVVRVLEGSRIWGGQDWVYHPVHPVKYLPLVEKANQELRLLAIEYGVLDPDAEVKVLDESDFN